MPYFVSLGSNIEPRHNFPLMVRALLELAPTVTLGRVVETEPVGVVGEPFLNAVATFESPLGPDELKQELNRIEAALGRDRSDPASKTKSRPADLDIVFHLPAGVAHAPAELLPPEPYVRPLLLDLLAALGVAAEAEAPTLPAGVALELAGLPFGRATRIFTRGPAGLAVADLV